MIHLLRRIVVANIISMLILAMVATYLLFALIALPVGSPDDYLQMLMQKTDPSQIQTLVKGIIQVLTNNFQAARTLVMIALFALVFQIGLTLFVRSGLKQLIRGTQGNGQGPTK